MREARALPTTLAGFRDFHAGETIIVCGCGHSLKTLRQPDRFLTIGVNDIGRLFHPNYLVILNPPHHFEGDRFRYVAESRAQALFTQLRLPIRHLPTVHLRLGARGGTDLSNPEVLPCTRNSPYVALCLAAHLGASRIGLIGVDFTDHHFFAQTGSHPLTGHFQKIDSEYTRLGEELARRGIEVVNLSAESRLTAFPKGALDDLDSPAEDRPREALREVLPEVSRAFKIFFVHYQFLSAGDVFQRGLEHAANELGLAWESAAWDDFELPAKVERFAPDLLFVVHGRNFRKRWGARFQQAPFDDLRSAVWLVDEPYEVDDTVRTSKFFDAVYVNDASTLERHQNAFYLPTCYDPSLHGPGEGEPEHEVGFIGGANPRREEMLLALADAGQLSYVVGGPWRSPCLRELCLSSNIPPDHTAELYRSTRIVVNVFRTQHHFNHQGHAALALNPRVYEALACGAMVVSEPRPELAEVFPEIPTFDDPTELREVVSDLLADPVRTRCLLASCRERLVAHRYVDRLRHVLRTFGGGELAERAASAALEGELPEDEVAKIADPDPPAQPHLDAPHADPSRPDVSHPTLSRPDASQPEPAPRSVPDGLELALPDGWLDCGGVTTVPGREDLDGGASLVFAKRADPRPGSELGIASRESFADVELAFEVELSHEAQFLAKLLQQDRLDQTTNSYHLYSDPQRSFVAMHNHAFRPVDLARGRWVAIRFQRVGEMLRLIVDGVTCVEVQTHHLRQGYCFLGVRSGQARLRNVRLGIPGEVEAASRAPGKVSAEPEDATAQLDMSETVVSEAVVSEAVVSEAAGSEAAQYEVLHPLGAGPVPRVSIVTTVYDRVGCLRHCLRSTRASNFAHWEQIVVADHPPPEVVAALLDAVQQEGDARVSFLNLTERHNNWGIAPAAVGLQQARGELVCFLSDDNTHHPEHLHNLVGLLDADSRFGFAYSSCDYDGRKILGMPPGPGRIDLGQPLFRRQLFAEHLGMDLPFRQMAWDWEMIEHFLQRGVRWRFSSPVTFFFGRARHLADQDHNTSLRGASETASSGPADSAEATSTELEAAASAQRRKISIVMATYRRAHTLPRTLDSLRAQTYGHWELVLVDNAGDLEESGLEKYLADPRIHLVRHFEKASASWARNRGLEHVTGDLVCFFDDDDEMFPDYLQRFVDTFDAHPQAQMVRCGMLLPNTGNLHFSHATPLCCLRREAATPTWTDCGDLHDQVYYGEILKRNGWSRDDGTVVDLHEALCRANKDEQGGLRAGAL